MRREFTVVERSLDCRLLGLVENAIVIGVVSRDISIHLCDVGEQQVSGRRSPLRSRVEREFQGTIGVGCGQGFSFGVVKLAIFVRIEGGDLWEDLSKVLHKRSRISLVMCQPMMQSAAAMNLRDGEPTDHETQHTSYHECFDVFHTILCV